MYSAYLVKYLSTHSISFQYITEWGGKVIVNHELFYKDV
jgi:hypothetical protein